MPNPAHKHWRTHIITGNANWRSKLVSSGYLPERVFGCSASLAATEALDRLQFAAMYDVSVRNASRPVVAAAAAAIIRRRTRRIRCDIRDQANTRTLGPMMTRTFVGTHGCKKRSPNASISSTNVKKRRDRRAELFWLAYNTQIDGERAEAEAEAADARLCYVSERRWLFWRSQNAPHSQEREREAAAASAERQAQPAASLCLLPTAVAVRPNKQTIRSPFICVFRLNCRSFRMPDI